MVNVLSDSVNVPSISNSNNINMSLGLTLTPTTKNGGFMVRLLFSVCFLTCCFCTRTEEVPCMSIIINKKLHYFLEKFFCMHLSGVCRMSCAWYSYYVCVSDVWSSVGSALWKSVLLPRSLCWSEPTVYAPVGLLSCRSKYERTSVSSLWKFTVHIKGIVHPKMNILSLITHPHVVSNL